MRRLESTEMGEVAKTYGTPRRTVLLDAAGGSVGSVAVAPANGRKKNVEPIDLQIKDMPTRVVLSATGLLARLPDDVPVPRDGNRAAHDALRGDAAASTRGHVGLVTSAGRMLRISVLDLPSLPPTDGAPSLSGGIPVSELVELEHRETVLAVTGLGAEAPTIAVGTAQGVVKRIAPSDAPAKGDEWPVIALKDGDTVVGAAVVGDDDELVFVADDTSLLHFPASSVRPQGRAAGGMAGIKLAADKRAVFFGAVPAGVEATVVTIAGAGDSLPGIEPGAGKVTPFALYPGKGRATGGVRSQRLLKGEDGLILAWVGATPPRALGAGGQPVDLPEVDERRDGSGTPIAVPVAVIG